MTNVQTTITILVGLLTIGSIIIVGLYNLIKLVIGLKTSLDTLKMNTTLGDEKLTDKVGLIESRLNYLDRTNHRLQEEVKDLKGIIRLYHPDSFRRLTDNDD